MAWGASSIYSLVDVDALAEGILLAAGHAQPGDDYLFCGQPTTIREMFTYWRRHPGGFGPGLWLPPWLMALLLAPLEPLQRALGLPAFLSRESVRVGSVDLNYRATRAQHDLGWTHPDPAAMWERTIATERRLIAARTGVLAKLRPDPVCPELC